MPPCFEKDSHWLPWVGESSGLALPRAFFWLTGNHSQKQGQGKSKRRRRTKALVTIYFLNSNDVPSTGHMAPSGAGVKCLEGEGGQTQRAITQDKVNSGCPPKDITI